MYKKTLIICFTIAFSNILVAKINNNYLTINEAISNLKNKNAAAKFINNIDTTVSLPSMFTPPFTTIEPIKLFDSLYFVGTTAVGAYIMETTEGLIMFDAGSSNTDAAIMVAGIKKLGLNPTNVKLIFISHEHFDHYGGVEYLKEHVCPNAKVAMSLLGWNFLQTVPYKGAYIGTRPNNVDIFLTDGMNIKIGNSVIQIVSTPGHSLGCVSFIIPVTDNGIPHVAGLMGGLAIFPTQTEVVLYKTSVEYFKAFAIEAKCDIGLTFHAQEHDFIKLRNKQPNQSNPFIIGINNFDSIYLNNFRNKYFEILNSGLLNK